MADLPLAPFSSDEARQFRHCIEAGVSIAGRIHFPGDARIDGKLQGEVHADHLLVISGGAKVEADIRARRLVVAGTLRGDIRESGAVEIRRTAKMSGRIEASRLVVEPGATFDGVVVVAPPQGAAEPVPGEQKNAQEKPDPPANPRVAPRRANG